MSNEGKFILQLQEYLLTGDPTLLRNIRKIAWVVHRSGDLSSIYQSFCVFHKTWQKLYTYNTALINIPKEYRDFSVVKVPWLESTPATIFHKLKFKTSKKNQSKQKSIVHSRIVAKETEGRNSNQSDLSVTYKLEEDTTGCIQSSSAIDNSSESEEISDAESDHLEESGSELPLPGTSNIESPPENPDPIGLTESSSHLSTEEIFEEHLNREEQEVLTNLKDNQQPEEPVNHTNQHSENPLSQFQVRSTLPAKMTTIGISTQRTGNDGSSIYGVASNFVYASKWLVSNEIFAKLVFPKLDVAPFNGCFDCPLVCQYIEIFCRIRCVDKKVPDQVNTAVALTMAELHGAFLGEYHMEVEDARKEFLRVINAYRKNPSEFSNAGVGTIAVQANDYVDPTQAVELLHTIITTDAGVTSPMCGPITIIANALCAYAKRGNISSDFKMKVDQAITAELSKPVSISVKACRIFYENYKAPINEKNAPDLFNHWKTIIPAPAIRLQLIVQQTAGSGLTAYYTICRAVQLYEKFPWHKVKALLTSDWTNFMIACEEIKGNPYFGFRNDLSSVRSTKYKNLAWVAKELLIEYNGEKNTLKNYMGWTKQPIFQDELRKLIDAYGEEQKKDLDDIMKSAKSDTDFKEEIKKIKESNTKLQQELKVDGAAGSSQ